MILNIKQSERIKRLPPYLFAEIEKLIHEKRNQGMDLISLSIGDPDLPPPKIVIDSIREEAIYTLRLLAFDDMYADIIADYTVETMDDIWDAITFSEL